ncbi:MAG: DoxX family protein [Candidatus Sericytochromatia bacterium]|nr:DoxX family protein [Candidatus Tanganyikabacteria bacterium]
MALATADWAPLPLRYAVGAVFFVHGANIVFGDLPEWGRRFAEVGFPMADLAAILVGVLEFSGGICLIMGLFTRFFALILCALAAIALIKIKWTLGFVVGDGALGWQGSGYEFELTLVAANLALVLTGGGLLSIDRLISPEDDQS